MQMPTVFKIPYFLPWAMSQCYIDKYSLLGYGDVIVPGRIFTLVFVVMMMMMMIMMTAVGHVTVLHRQVLSAGVC